jgi:polyphosphate kinase
VEAVVQIDDANLQKRLYDTLQLALNDNRTAWDLRSDGRYMLRYPPESGPVINFQETLMAQARESVAGTRGRKRRSRSSGK